MIVRALALLASFVSPLPGLAQDKDGIEFFEQKIRPVLAERCYSCHSATAEKLKGGLLLDTKEGVLKGGDQGPVLVPGDPDRSLLIKGIRWTDDDFKMPPKKKLAPEQVADFEAWVRRGAPDPRGKDVAKPGVDLKKALQHWAFQPVKDVAVPKVRAQAWVRTPMDAFIAAKLEERSMAPSRPADPFTLLRRVTYDLTGLPPTPEEVDAFLADASSDAYERAVERLLASPRYGERWGRHWLDAARYADTKGYVYSDREEAKFVHSSAFRDWTIRAFNEDLPFDRFLMLQIAADQLVPADDKRDLAAMGFLTVGRRFINNIHDIIDDRIDTMSRAMMGLTVSCARCHDHKFDPIPQADYYSLYGVFLGSSERLLPVIENPERSEAYVAYETELRKREAKLAETVRKKSEALLERLRYKVPDYLAAVLDVQKLPTEDFYMNFGADDVIPFIVRRWHVAILATKKDFHPVFAAWHALEAIPEKELATLAPKWIEENAARLNPRIVEALKGEPLATMKDAARRIGKAFAEVHKKAKAGPLADAADEEIHQIMVGADSPIALPRGHFSEIEWYFDEGTRVEMGKQNAEIERWILQSDAAPPQADILEDRPVQQNPRIFRRGNPANKGEEVPRRTLLVLGGEKREPFQQGSGRLDIARAIASPENPLTARVWVNRVWMQHFGHGLVRTPSDFGLRSDAPTHPELLDFLARWFVANGWSTKKLHRLIVLSNTYRQSSEDNPAFRQTDPENRLLWRMPRRRLDFEAMRDSMLAVSGKLDLKMGGKSVPLTNSPAIPRRSVYGFVDRLNVPGLLRVFDFASVDAHAPQRHMTTVPQQALFLINSPFAAEQARSLAARPGVADAKDPAEGIRTLYRIVYGRAASEKELALGVSFVGQPFEKPTPVKPGPWHYGWGEVDEAAGKVKAFNPLPHYTGAAWQGGPAWPDAALGWVMLDAKGGHVGNDLKHAAIRRWVAPRDGTLTISGTAAHKNKEGDGVRARLFSSRSGELGSWTLKQLEAEMKIKGIEVKKDEAIDFVVDCRPAGNINSDEFLWAPVIQMAKISEATGGTSAETEWNAQTQFAGPPPAAMSPWERYAQALMVTNEFFFLD